MKIFKLPQFSYSRKCLLFLVGSFFLIGIIAGYLVFFLHPVDQAQQETNTADSNQRQRHQPVMPQKTSLGTGLETGTDIANVYPFIFSETTPGGIAGVNANISNRAIPNVSMPLPAIPNYQPRPYGLPTPNLPPIPTFNGSQQGTTPVQKPSPVTDASIQGVFTGNNGSNIAIMSDGKIVQEGDSYGDNHIAYIGGDGIQFDNGNTINYGTK